MDPKFIVMQYIQHYLGYRGGSKIKLKDIYQHFLETNSFISFKLFREQISIIFDELNNAESNKRRIEIIKQNNTYFVENLDWRDIILKEKEKMIELTKTFYAFHKS